MRGPVQANHVIAALLAVAAVLFVTGVRAESGEVDHNDAPAAEAVEHREAGEARESEEAESEEAESEEAESEEAERADGDDERVLGVDVESPLLVGVAVVGSLLLAALAWWRPTRGVLVLAGGVAAAFAALDLAEVVHQLDESHTGLGLLAAAIAVFHATAASLAFRQAMTTDAKPAPATR